MTAEHEDDALTKTRHRALAMEHLLFQTIRALTRDHPDLLKSLEASLDHLWDNGPRGHHDDDAVREIARTFLKSLGA